MTRPKAEPSSSFANLIRDLIANKQRLTIFLGVLLLIGLISDVNIGGFKCHLSNELTRIQLAAVWFIAPLLIFIGFTGFNGHVAKIAMVLLSAALVVASLGAVKPLPEAQVTFLSLYDPINQEYIALIPSSQIATYDASKNDLIIGCVIHDDKVSYPYQAPKDIAWARSYFPFPDPKVATLTIKVPCKQLEVNRHDLVEGHLFVVPKNRAIPEGQTFGQFSEAGAKHVASAGFDYGSDPGLWDYVERIRKSILPSTRSSSLVP